MDEYKVVFTNSHPACPIEDGKFELLETDGIMTVTP